MIFLQICVFFSWIVHSVWASNIPLVSKMSLEPTLNSTTLANLTVVPPANPGRSRSFIDAVYAEVLHMSIIYPTASFVQAQLTSVSGPTIDPTKLSDVRLIFKIHGEDAFYTIFVQNKEHGGWNSPQVVRQEPPPQDGVLPSGLGMDILVADLLIKDAGYGQDYEAVDVRWPTNYPIAKQQVYYFFHMAGDYPSMVAVGADSHEVIARNESENDWISTKVAETD